MSLSQQRTTMGRCSNQQQQQHRRQRADQAQGQHRGGRGRSLSTWWMSTTVLNQVSTRIRLWSRSVTILYLQGPTNLHSQGLAILYFQVPTQLTGTARGSYSVVRAGKTKVKMLRNVICWRPALSRQGRQMRQGRLFGKRQAPIRGKVYKCPEGLQRPPHDHRQR